MSLKSYNAETAHNHSIAVVIPVYNEERFIQKVIQSIPLWIQTIIVVDDASTDSSSTQISNIHDRRLTVLYHRTNHGVGASIVLGYRKALDLDCDIVVVMGGDAQMDPDDLPDLINPIIQKKADYVKGNRFMHAGTSGSMPFNRKIGNHLFTFMTQWALSNQHISDSQCGFTAISAKALRKLDLSKIYPRYGYPNDMLFQVANANCRISESPVKAIYGSEKSGINPFTTVPQMVFLIFRLALTHRITCLANFLSRRKAKTAEIEPENL